MVIIESVPQPIMHQAVDKLAIAQLRAGSAVGKHMRRAAHVFLAAGDHYIRFAALDGLSRQVQRFQPGAANVVDGDRRNGIRQPATDRRLTRRILPGARGQHLTEDHFINALRIDSAPLD